MSGPPDSHAPLGLPARSASSRAVVAALLIVPTLCVFAWLLAGGIPICCDGVYYHRQITGYQRHGLFFPHQHVGYRGYLFPYLYALLPLDFRQTAFADVTVYSVVAIAVFVAVEGYVLWRLQGERPFWPVYLGLFANPLVLVYVPYPLQESFIVVVFAAVVPLLLARDPRTSGWGYAALLGAFFGALYMARASHVVLAVPVALLLASHLRARREAVARLASVGAFALLAVLLIAPQSAISHRHSGSLVPYPSEGVLEQQLAWGRSFAKYATNVSDRENVGRAMPFWNPLACESDESADAKSLRRFVCSAHAVTQRDGAAAVLFTALIHAYGALDYHALRPYIVSPELPLFPAVHVLSMTVVFFGGYGAVRKVWRRAADSRDLFLIAIVGVTLAVAAVVAVETRFGVLATAALSVLAVETVLHGGIDRREWVPLAFGFVLFLATSSLLSVYELALSGAAAP